jgi:hypothetical protein
MDILGYVIPNVYLQGVGGSLAVEIFAVVKASASIGGACPPPYNKPFYVCARVVMALAAGSVPVMLDAQNVLNAVVLGASAPLFYDRAARGVGDS